MNSVLKIPFANFCRLIPFTHPRHSRCVASWNFNCVWFADSDSKSETLLKVCSKAFNFSIKLLSVLSKQLAYNPWTRPIFLNTSMPSCRNECNEGNVGQYVKTIVT